MELGKGQIIDMSTLQNEAHEALAESWGQKAMDRQLPVVYLAGYGETAWTLAGRHTSFTHLSLTLWGERDALAVLYVLDHRCKWRGLPCCAPANPLAHPEF